MTKAFTGQPVTKPIHIENRPTVLNNITIDNATSAKPAVAPTKMSKRKQRRTNCLIDVADSRPAGSSVMRLIEAADAGVADVAMIASSASERQPGGGFLETINDFKARMHQLGFGSVKLLEPIARWELSFWDYAIQPTDSQTNNEQLIFETLFPNIPYHWQDYAALNGIEALDEPQAFKWRNRLCDAQAFWGHVENRRDVFVTSHARFKRRLSPSGGPFSAHTIATPAEAVEILKSPD
jgi:hypothetical protein